MSDLNLCQFIGRLGADPETKYTQGGQAITNIRIACGWKSKEKDGTEWIPVTFFGRLAEVAGEYLRKGSQVYIQGRFHTDQWEQDGKKRFRSVIHADRMQMLDQRPREGAAPDRSGAPDERQADDFSDDIPF